MSGAPAGLVTVAANASVAVPPDCTVGAVPVAVTVIPPPAGQVSIANKGLAEMGPFIVEETARYKRVIESAGIAAN